MDTPHRLHVSVTAPQLEALQNESHVTGAPVAEVVRRAVDEYLSRRTEYKDRNTGNPALRGHVHHVDGNPRNNDLSNLKIRRGGK